MSFHKAMHHMALLHVILASTEEEKRKVGSYGNLQEQKIYFDVNDLSQNTRRVNFPERKFTNKEPQITFRR